MKIALSRKNLWERLPRPFKRAVGGVLGMIPVEGLLGSRFQKGVAFLKESEHWTREQVVAYQLGEVRRVCVLAYEKTPFYRNLFKSAGFEPRDLESLEILERLPTIDRDVVNGHLEQMRVASPRPGKVDYITTGGTSGVPLRFYIGSGRSAIEYPYLVESWRRAGFELGMPMAVLRGRVIRPDRSGFHHEYDPILRHHYYSTFHMTEESMARYVGHIKTLGSCFLHVYPSSVASLARFLRRSGEVPPRNVRGILAESENVYEEQRQMVEEVFGCRYFSSYGHTEKVVAAAECENSHDYHVWPTYGYFELLDSSGIPVRTPGERGEIVGTGFINEVVPFIRYRTGDYATYVGDSCTACGRAHVIIKNIRGHNIQENLVANDGSLIPWSAINMHDDTFDSVLRFQFCQDRPGSAVLKIVPAPVHRSADIGKIQSRLGSKFGGRLSFTVETVHDIALSGRGKAIFVDQRIPWAGEFSEPGSA